jgi:hypothetical protein
VTGREACEVAKVTIVEAVVPGETRTHGPAEKTRRERGASRSPGLCSTNNESWVGLTTGVDSSKPQMEIVDDGNELESIQWPDEEVIESNPWTDSALFTEDSILVAGEPVGPMWVVDSGATHHVTARRELLRDVR